MFQMRLFTWSVITSYSIHYTKLYEFVPAGNSTVTFNNVADLGPGAVQPPVGIYGLYRFMPSGPLPDVKPNTTVFGGDLIMFSVYSGIDAFGTGKVSWKADGSALAYGMRTYSSISQIPANPPYGSIGALV